jgi:hypothetical protein
VARPAASVFATMLLLFAASCDQRSEGGGALEEALSFAPASYSSFGFTDWDAMRTYGGLEETEPENADAQTLADLNQPDTPLTFTYGALQYPDHRSTWGWNELDLDWEADVIPTEGSPFNVLGFNDDYDLSDLTSKLEEQGFESSEIEGGEFYEIDDPLSLFDEAPTTDMKIARVAVLSDENVAIVGAEQESVEIHAEEEGSLAGSDTTASIVDRFGDYASVALAPGDTCARPPLGPRATPQIAEQLEDLRGNAYETLALGYRIEDEGETTGTIAMHYADASEAEEDLELRTGVLEEENSLVSAQPYSELLEVTGSEVDDSDLVIEVSATDGRLQLFEMFLQQDLSFALC